MVHLNKAFIITIIAFAPALAAPLQFVQDNVDLMAREPWSFGSIVKDIRHDVGKVERGVKKVVKKVDPVIKRVAPVAALIPGPIGAVGAVASALARRDLVEEEALYDTRAVQDLSDNLEARQLGDLPFEELD